MELHQCPYKAALFIQRAPPCAVLLAGPAHLSQRRPPCFATRASAPLWTRTATLHVRPPSQPDASAFMLVRGLTRIPSAFRPLDNLCDTERNALNYFLLPHTPEGKQQLSAIKEAIDRRGMRAPLVRGERPVPRPSGRSAASSSSIALSRPPSRQTEYSCAVETSRLECRGDGVGVPDFARGAFWGPASALTALDVLAFGQAFAGSTPCYQLATTLEAAPGSARTYMLTRATCRRSPPPLHASQQLVHTLEPVSEERHAIKARVTLPGNKGGGMTAVVPPTVPLIVDSECSLRARARGLSVRSSAGTRWLLGAGDGADDAAGGTGPSDSRARGSHGGGGGASGSSGTPPPRSQQVTVTFGMLRAVWKAAQDEDGAGEHDPDADPLTGTFGVTIDLLMGDPAREAQSDEDEATAPDAKALPEEVQTTADLLVGLQLRVRPVPREDPTRFEVELARARIAAACNEPRAGG